MWNPISLKIKNLFSYEDSYFTFKNGEITVVYGKNMDADNTDSCGSGKSSFLDCISISLLGEPLRSVGKNDIIRNGEKSGTTIFELHNPVLDKDLRIESIINSGSTSSKVLIYENNVLNKQKSDLKAAEGYKYIISLIGISKEDLMNYFLISKESYQSFFLSGDTQKKDIINRFSKADIIDNVNPHIDEDVKLLDEALKELNTQLSANESVLLHINEEIAQEKIESSIEKTRKLTIDSLNNKVLLLQESINKLPEEIIKKQDDVTVIECLIKTGQTVYNDLNKEKNATEIKITDLESKITAIGEEQSKLDTLYEPIFTDFNNKKSIIEVENKRYEASIKETNKEIKEIDTVLAGQIECPKCEHKFILKDKEYNIETATKEREQLVILIDEVEKLITVNDEQLIKLDVDIEKIKSELAVKNKDFVDNRAVFRTQLNEFNVTLTSLNKKIKDQEALINSENKKKDQLEIDLTRLENQKTSLLEQIKDTELSIQAEKDKKYPSKLDDLEIKVQTLTEQNESLKNDILEIQNDKNTLLEWEVRFKQFKSFIANTSIAAIQDMMNFYLDKMKTNLSVIIEGYRELSNKKMKEEITTLVCRDGLNGENFKKFSGGEKAQINVAGILSMQKIINLTAKNNGGLNLIFIDEVIESADGLLMKYIIKSLSLIGSTIFIITHVEPDNSYECNRLKIVKHKSISMIKEENDIVKVEETEAIQKSSEEDLKTDSQEEDIKPKKKIKTNNPTV